MPMRFEEFSALLLLIRNSAYSRDQIGKLLGEVAARICSCDEPEFEKLQHDLSETCEEYETALDEIAERESRFERQEAA